MLDRGTRVSTLTLCCFFELPGLTPEQLDRQMTLFAEQVPPMIGAEMSA